VLGSAYVLIPAAVLVGAWFFRRRRGWSATGRMLVAIVGAVALQSIVKAMVERPRPTGGITDFDVSGSSFPSGHAVRAVAFWGMLALLVSDGRTRKQQAVIWSVAGVVAALVAASRVYLGVHWLSDVVGGIALGGLWVAFLVTVIELGRARTPARPLRNPDG